MKSIKYRPFGRALLRKDFEYSSECGFYHCHQCGYDCYPMEINIQEDSFKPECPSCLSTQVQHIKAKPGYIIKAV